MSTNKNTILQNTFSFFLVGFFLYFSHVANNSFEKPFIKISKQTAAINLNADVINFFNLGYRRMITAIMWISTILEGDHEHYKQKDLNSWMYLRFKFISILDPKFYENYAFGGPYLSIIKDDLLGASEIYELGLSKYPDDYVLIFNAAFHYFYEVKNRTRGLELYGKIIRNPQTPPHIVSVFSRFNFNFENANEAFKILSTLLETNKNNDFLKKRITYYLYSIKAEQDLECLNAGKQTCSHFDYYGLPYVVKNNKYIAQEKWESYFKR